MESTPSPFLPEFDNGVLFWFFHFIHKIEASTIFLFINDKIAYLIVYTGENRLFKGKPKLK